MAKEEEGNAQEEENTQEEIKSIGLRWGMVGRETFGFGGGGWGEGNEVRGNGSLGV